MKKALVDKLDLDNLHNKSPAEFEQHKKALLALITEQIEGSLMDKISNTLSFSPSKPKTKGDIYAALTTILVEYRWPNKVNNDTAMVLNHERTFEVMGAIIANHPDVLTGELLASRAAARWGVFLHGLYIKADLENLQLTTHAEQATLSSSASNKSAAHYLARAQKIKAVFEKFEKLVHNAKIIELKKSTSEGSLSLDDSTEKQLVSPKSTRKHRKKIARTRSEQPKEPEIDDALYVDVTRVSSQKLALRSQPSPMPSKWTGIYDDIRISLSSLSAALSFDARVPQAPSLKVDVNTVESHPN
ncbi:MAG: hypothetical protein K2Q14_07395 [Gammaproteobacteria bacterium]|nr:hypothetical protein [Gammaproteobacteria bacterium]